MKRLLMVTALIFMSLNFVACAEKKENKTRLSHGANRNSGVSGQPTTNGWNDLNNNGLEVYLYSSDYDAATNAFFYGNDGSYGHVTFNTVAMRLSFHNGQVIPSQTRLGLRFYDAYDPLSYYVGGDAGNQVQGQISGNVVDVVFNDGGTIHVHGTTSGGTFNGTVTFDNEQQLGSFSVSVTSSVYFY